MRHRLPWVVVLGLLASGCKPRDEDGVAGAKIREESAGQDPERAPEGTLIPRSMFDKGKYYLLESKRVGNIVKALHKRVGVDAIGYTRTETNCKTMLMREMGYSEEGRDKITTEPTKWFTLVEGSNKSDLAKFVCRR